MSNHLLIRVNDQYQCSCGLQWDVGEVDPHAPDEDKTVTMHRSIGNSALIDIKENLNRE